MEHYLNTIQNSIKANWDSPAFTDWGGATYSYGQVAAEVEKYHLFLAACAVRQSDKIALCAANSSRLAAALLAVGSYQAVAVPLLSDFSPAMLADLLEHSDSVGLFTDRATWNRITAAGLHHRIAENRNIKFVADLEAERLLYASSPAWDRAYRGRASAFRRRHPQGFFAADFALVANDMDDLALISYTSGTTCAPKGVMISERSISSNLSFAIARMPNKQGWHVLCYLTVAHLYSYIFDFLYPFATGCHIYFAHHIATPKRLVQALDEVRPYMLTMVPGMIEELVNSKLMPLMKHPLAKMAMSLPLLRQGLLFAARRSFLHLFGNRLYGGIILGGAPVSPPVDKLLSAMRLPYTVGYGMTECGPLVCYEHFGHYKKRSCGRPVWNVEVKIDSCDPMRTPGEIMVKGVNVMSGYYKDPQATAAAIDAQGWLHTGDMGMIDRHGNLFMVGRRSSSLPVAGGRRIYPEEIELMLNASPLVAESLVVMRHRLPVAIVYPGEKLLSEHDAQELCAMLNLLLYKVNGSLPEYSRLRRIELRQRPFKKTPKHSIKRYLYA